MRVYTYARYSTDRQTEASIVDQQRRCHEYAASHGWRVAADFIDEGISGAAIGNRLPTQDDRPGERCAVTTGARQVIDAEAAIVREIFERM